MVSLITVLATLLALVPFLRPDDPARRVLLWPIKLFCGALTPILGPICALGTLLGLVRRDWKLTGAGTLGLAFVIRFLRDIPVSGEPTDSASDSYAQANPADSREPLRAVASSLAQRADLAARSRHARVHRDVAYGAAAAGAPPASGTEGGPRWLVQRRPKPEGSLLADIWEPEPGAPRSGLAVVYVHGGGWRIGDKDMATRTFFQRLAAQGHVVMDISYDLWPEAEIATMVGEVKRAVLWLKERSQAYHVDPERLVLMGGSAGAHLALLAAYTPGHTALSPAGSAGDTSVRGVAAFYPPVDFFALWELNQETFAREGSSGAQGLIERAAEGMLDWTFALPDPELGADVRFRSFLSAILGGDPGEARETYHLLSPSSHVGPHCPPTLLLQGCDDVFHLASSVRGLHQDLQAAGVPAKLVEYPHTEHAFDLVLPQISPLAKAASQDVERFLAHLA